MKERKVRWEIEQEEQIADFPLLCLHKSLCGSHAHPSCVRDGVRDTRGLVTFQEGLHTSATIEHDALVRERSLLMFRAAYRSFYASPNVLSDSAQAVDIDFRLSDQYRWLLSHRASSEA